MPNRLVRDELILTALRMAQIPNLDIEEAPNGVVLQTAKSIDWLQEVVDYWHHLVPFSATIAVDQDMSCLAGSDMIILPADFIIDVRNGYFVQTIPNDFQSFKQTRRVPVPKFMRYRLMYQKKHDVQYPYYYCVVGDDNDELSQRQTMMVCPTPTINTVAKMWYYRLPGRLAANQKPKVPTDYVCVEYLRIRMLEWAHLFEPGTAQKFCDRIVSGMRAGGLLNEPEDDAIPMDEQSFGRAANHYNSYAAWMGPV
jgi:hypothetical protein